MKKLIIYIVLILVCQNAFSQLNQIIDTLYSYENREGVLYSIFKQDSFYYVEGHTNIPMEKFFLKINQNGNIVQKKLISESIINFGGRYFNSIIQVDSGFVNASYRQDSTLFYGVLMYIDYNFDTIWVKKFYPNLFYPGVQEAYLQDVKQTPDKGFIVCGEVTYPNSGNLRVPFLMKLDKFGNSQWLKKYDSIDNIGISFYRLKLTPDLGIMLLTNRLGGSLIKTNALGDIQWITKIPNDSVYPQDADFELVGSNDYIVSCRFMYDYIPNMDIINTGISLCKINNTSGQVIWEKTYIPFESLHFYPKMQLHSLSNGDFLLSATTDYILINYNPNIGQWKHVGFAMRFNTNGDSLHTELYYNWKKEYCWLHSFLLEPSGSVVGVGTAVGNNLYKGTGWFFRSNTNGVLVLGDKISNNNELILNIYPNPTNGIINIQIPDGKNALYSIFDLQGKILLSGKIESRNIDISSLANGMYFVKISFDDFQREIVKTIIKQEF